MAKQTTSSANKNEFGRFDFMRIAFPMGILSLVLVLASLALIFTKGFNYGIDFAGGTEVQVRFDQPVEASDLRAALEDSGIKDPSVQAIGTESEFIIRLGTPVAATDTEVNALINANVKNLREMLTAKFGLKDDGVLRIDTVGPQVGSELKRNGLLAAFYSLLAILIYVGLRFDYKYAPGAVICLMHDAIVTLGIFSLLGREVNVQILAAVLTLIGYSLNDTIVTFDRIRETGPMYRGVSSSLIINKGINDTLGRTLLTAGTTLLAVFALFFIGGGVIADISFALIIGIIAGTFSSIYVAAPLVLVAEKFQKRDTSAAAA